MKTIKEWLKEYLTQEEYKKAKKYKSELWKDKTQSFRMALVLAFIWNETEEKHEKHDYWYNISKRETPLGKVKQKDSIVDSIVNEFKNRSEVGFKKYGTTLDREDLTELEWRIHFREELMDAILYNEKVIKILKSKL